MNYRELLYNKDNVLSFYPELAVILNKYDEIECERVLRETGKAKKADRNGLNKAIFINQLHYWNDINEKSGNNFKDGYYWVYNSYAKWAENDFPYWSTDTIKRIVNSLEEIGVVVSANYNKYKIDKTKWYRIDCEKLQEIIDLVKNYEAENGGEEVNISQQEGVLRPMDGDFRQTIGASCPDTRGQVAYTERASCPDVKGSLHRPIPENTTENTTEISTENTHGETRARMTSDDGAEMGLPHDYTDKQLFDFLSWKIPNLVKRVFGGEWQEYVGPLTETINHFYLKYKVAMGKRYARLSDDAYIRVIDALFHPPKILKNNIWILNTMSYRIMIDLYFDTEYKDGSDYGLSYFVSPDVAENLFSRMRDLYM